MHDTEPSSAVYALHNTHTHTHLKIPECSTYKQLINTFSIIIINIAIFFFFFFSFVRSAARLPQLAIWNRSRGLYILYIYIFFYVYDRSKHQYNPSSVTVLTVWTMIHGYF